ncbi:MAG TPA: ATP-binding protein [Rhodopila sp.]|nr:ATP-binding protein [Rhodopila sp.]
MDIDRLRIETERIRCVFQQARLTLLVTVLNAALIVLVMRPVVGAGALAVWLGLNTAIAGIRFMIRQAFLRRRPEGADCRPWIVASVLGSAATGLLWGIGVAAMFPEAETYQLFLAFVVGGMCAGSVTVNSSHLPTVLAFILPASLPLAASFLMQGSLTRTVSAFMIIVFVTALSITSIRAHRSFGERIQLQLALTREQRSLMQANDRLRAEMAERRKAEAELFQAQKIEAIGHLTGGIAHDFNNLLQVVSGKLELIRRTTEAEGRALGYILDAQQAVKQGAQLTSSLLAFARRQTLQVEPVDVNALLREFRPILAQAAEGNVQLKLDLADDVPKCWTDPAQLQAAILNLVINARDAMPAGGEVRISTGPARLTQADLARNPDAKPGGFVHVTVRDNGVGMTDAVLAQAFEPFFTTKEAGKGSGLGLSQVYGYARQSGGHVTLHSALGTGTEVALFLPVRV